MFKNYLKIAWRNLFRNKSFAVTNLLGLTIGVTCTMLILLWVQDEVSYNKFHANYKNIYQVMANRDFNNQVFTDPNMVLPLAKSIAAGSSQVKYAVVATHNQPAILANGDTRLKKEGHTVSEHFFDMFSWKFIKGNAATALPDPYAIVLTASAAKSLFGDTDPIGKMLKVDNDYNAKVTAVIADPPGNSTFRFDYINTFNYDNDFLKNAMGNWVNSSWEVFVQTVPNANLALLEKNINDIKHQHDPGDKKISTYFAFPMTKWRLYSDFENGKNTGGMIEYVKLFSIIAVIILLIACVNFMNLSTARSEKRSKEVGIRKTLGSDKRQLILQFFFESMILVAIAFVFSVLAVYLLLPSFNSLVDKQLFLDLSQPVFWISAAAIIVLTGIVAGSYPALYLSSFNPVKVLKGTFLTGKKALIPRRILVVAQFVISILLISSTIIVYRQIQHVKSRGLGYNPDNLITLPAYDDINKNFAAIKQELLQTGMMEAVSRSSAPMTDVWWRSMAPDWNGRPANMNIIVNGLSADEDFTKAAGIKLLKGRYFTGVPSDTSSMLLNKAAVEAMDLKEPVGMQMRYGRSNFTVIGVMDNVVMESPYKPVNPQMIFYNRGGFSTVNIRLRAGVQLQKALEPLAAIIKKYNPSVPFEYQFVDDEFGKKFLTEELIGKITNIFAGLAIFICCIGLAGLASFTIEKRFREIGIRKVLGASVQQLLLLISKEFLQLVAIAFIIAIPLTWWAMTKWLDNYTYRISISVWVFVAVGAVVLLLTLLIVWLNIARAALANPTKSLRTE
jgi:putative ABC transport system permease protein